MSQDQDMKYDKQLINSTPGSSNKRPNEPRDA